MPNADPRRALQQWLTDGGLPVPADEAEGAALVAEAERQGLAGLLHHEALHSGSSWPAAACARLADFHRAYLFRGTQQLETATRVLQMLAAADVRAIPLKGAALAESLYDSVAERPMADVDILVLADWGRALEAIGQMGLSLLERADHARVFRDPATGTVIELHHSLTSCPGLFPFDADALWARRAEGRTAAEDLLVHLCLHAAFQHGLVLSLVQWLDLRRLLERLPIEPERLLAVAHASKALHAVAAALAVAEAVVGAPVPDLRRWADRRGDDPLSFVAPTPARLARWRWRLTEGRHGELLVRTLLPREPGERRSALFAPIRAVTRAAGLASRWMR